MPSKPNGPVRRSQLIAPFGPGAMVTVPGGTSLVVAGPEYWFEGVATRGGPIDDREFRIREWRLQRRLGVGHFRTPPDFREPGWLGQEVPNSRITIPAFRFPMWHFCPSCKHLEQRPMFERGTAGRVRCEECRANNKTRYMFQVPFVAMCQNGHIQDFPWREWVHRSPNPKCEGALRLVATGASTLAGQRVSCDACGATRTLAGITTANPQGTSTTLSSTLAEGVEYQCRGLRPWLGPDGWESCDMPLRGSLRSASNVYFAHVRSSIYLPRSVDAGIQDVVALFEELPISSLIGLLRNLEAEDRKILEALRNQYGTRLREFADDQLLQAYRLVAKPDVRGELEQEAGDPVDPEEAEETGFRRAEFRILRSAREGEPLKIRAEALGAYDQEVARYFSRITLVDRLRETRALAGFTRVFPETGHGLDDLRRMLWGSPAENPEASWLPAYTVYGEGIFFEFDEGSLRQWEGRAGVIRRVQPLVDRYRHVREDRHLRQRAVGARFVLLHTFAHLLMNRLTFECGYSSAALRERLYVSDTPKAPMAGLLIYTADGDSDGTLGGLVRMGKPGNIEPTIQRALEDAQWCSADPVCMELGRHQGQGPDSCNLAACHNCALVPETACEEFNRFLDRGIVVGDLDNFEIGFFRTQ